MKTPTSILTAALLLSAPAHAVILFGAGNDTNLTSPGNGLPFDSVARVASSFGSDGSGGSGVHIGNGFMLTAAHIPDSQLNSVTFDGINPYSRDLSFTPIQIGTADLKLFKLTTVPSVGAANLYTGSAELLNEASLVGWGRQRAEPVDVGPTIVPIAGGNTPLVKRWGTNQPRGLVEDFVYTAGSTYTFDAIQTVMGTSAGTNEAAAVSRDSGSGLFQLIDGEWYLTGITSLFVFQNSGNVTFGTDTPWIIEPGSPNHTFSFIPGSGDINIFVQISSYAADIAILIPEPSSLLLACPTLLLLLRRRRCDARH